MGCGSSKSEVPEGRRRRLSVGHVENDGGEAMGSDSTEDRGLLAKLSQESILQLLQSDEHTGRRFSISTETDQVKTSFANKSFAHVGDKIDSAQLGLGYTCRKGLKPESPNQDSYTVLRVDDSFELYGVFDGHGQSGHDISNYVAENLTKLILRDQRFKTADMPTCLTDAFKKVQSLIGTADRMKKLSAQMSGTTATLAIHDHAENKLTVAHVADSTCVLGYYLDEGKSKLKGQALTRDHKPNLADEKARIEKAGGRVVFDGYANHRVYAKNGRYPGLNMSRCLGDLMGHADAGCTCIPEISERVVTPLDHVLLLCSDGVWEFITPQEAVEKVGKELPGQAMNTAEGLAKDAWDRWIWEEGGTVVDDITVILKYFSVLARRNPLT